jgi:hypothetical protein
VAWPVKVRPLNVYEPVTNVFELKIHQSEVELYLVRVSEFLLCQIEFSVAFCLVIDVHKFVSPRYYKPKT